MNLRFLISLFIMFISLSVFFTLIETKWKDRKKIKDFKGFRLTCPKCDTVLAEVVFPSETLIFHSYHGAIGRVVKSKRKLGEGEYYVECYKCNQELTFHANNIRKEYECWEDEENLDI